MLPPEALGTPEKTPQPWNLLLKLRFVKITGFELGWTTVLKKEISNDSVI